MCCVKSCAPMLRATRPVYSPHGSRTMKNDAASFVQIKKGTHSIHVCLWKYALQTCQFRKKRDIPSGTRSRK